MFIHLFIRILQHIFRASLEGRRVPNPENPGGFVTTANISGEPLPNIDRSLAVWEGPRQLQEQFNRRLTDIGSLVEPVQAKVPEFLGNFAKGDVLVSTIGPVPAESGCFNLWAVVLVQGNRKMAFTGKE
jgi:hypothetical protein